MLRPHPLDRTHTVSAATVDQKRCFDARIEAQCANQHRRGDRAKYFQLAPRHVSDSAVLEMPSRFFAVASAREARASFATAQAHARVPNGLHTVQLEPCVPHVPLVMTPDQPPYCLALTSAPCCSSSLATTT